MKNIRLGVKLIGGFVLVTLITVLIGIQDHLALDAIEEDLKVITEVEMPSIQAVLNLKVDVQRIRSNTHLILSQFITLEERQKTHERVAHIREDMRKQIETFKAFPMETKEEKAALQEFETALNAWRDANNKILKSSEELIALGIAKPNVFAADLQRIGAAHHALMSNLGKLVLFGTKFDGGIDGDKCPLGQWLLTFQTPNQELNALITKLKPIHHALHESVSAIKKDMDEGKEDDAKKAFRDKAIPAAQQVFAIFSEMLEISNKALSNYQSMETIFGTEVVKHRDAVLKGIDHLVETNLQSAKLEEEHALQNSVAVKTRSGILVAVGSVISVVIGIILTLSIVRPLQKGVVLARSMADGDLTKTMDVHQKDEIGILAEALNEMVHNLRSMMNEIVSEVGKMSSASVSLASIAEQMTNGATTSVHRASQVSTSVSHMSENQVSVAAAMEQASVNVNTVATATEEMSATIGEIASNSGKAKSITDQAVQQAAEASARVNELGVAANEINKVTETITAISSQTNLLALNATIEAARAGDAGRGFAVVANEIKELAQQTARATEDIRAKIQGIQQATSLTVGEIGDISHVIGEVDAIVATIAAAVEEQSVTTREIAENVGQASTGIAEVNSKVAQDAAMAGDIAKDITDVSTQANETLLSSEQVKLSASGLSDTAATLKNLVSRFRLSA